MVKRSAVVGKNRVRFPARSYFLTLNFNEFRVVYRIGERVSLKTKWLKSPCGFESHHNHI